MGTRKFSAVFGPVPSRRLGRSLGIDLVPFKTCSYDCVYCQLGPTTAKTLDRREFLPLDGILESLDRKLAEVPRPDYITLSGSGEPTLYSRLGELVEAVKQRTTIPLGVLTNGSLLGDPDVRSALREADLVVPSLDAGDAEAFAAVNRPHPDISFEAMREGLITFRARFPGQLWLEVFLVEGVTDRVADVEKIAAVVERIRPDRVQLNTVIRPPAVESTAAVPERRLRRLATLFEPEAEVIAEYESRCDHGGFGITREAVLELLRRRPCSLDDISQGLAAHPNEVVKYLDDLRGDGTVTALVRDGTTFFAAGSRS